MKNKEIKAVIFDSGGVYFNKGMWVAMETLSQKYNIPFQKIRETLLLKYYNDLFSGKVNSKEYWEECMQELGFTESVSELNDLMINSFKINEGMDTLVKELRAKGYKTILLSDQILEFWKRLDKKFNLSKSFDLCIISAEIGLAKPDPAIYKFVLKKIEFSPKECIFIDDREDNLESAERIGINTILYENTDKLKEDLKQLSIKWQ